MKAYIVRVYYGSCLYSVCRPPRMKKVKHVLTQQNTIHNIHSGYMMYEDLCFDNFSALGLLTNATQSV